MKGQRTRRTEREPSIGSDGGPVVVLDEGRATRSVQAQNCNGSAVGFKDIGEAVAKRHMSIIMKVIKIIILERTSCH